MCSSDLQEDRIIAGHLEHLTPPAPSSAPDPSTPPVPPSPPATPPETPVVTVTKTDGPSTGKGVSVTEGLRDQMRRIEGKAALGTEPSNDGGPDRVVGIDDAWLVDGPPNVEAADLLVRAMDAHGSMIEARTEWLKASGAMLPGMDSGGKGEK